MELLPIKSLVKNGLFREDLFYRLEVVSIHIPALRERKEDIPLLVDHFLDKYALEYKKPVKKLSEEAMKMFVSYSWPGNIRELENKIQQLVVLSTSSVIDANELNLSRYESYTNKPVFEQFNLAKKKAIDAFEKTYLVNLLDENKGNIVNAAKKAGKSRTSFWNILKKHNISPK